MSVQLKESCSGTNAEGLRDRKAQRGDYGSKGPRSHCQPERKVENLHTKKQRAETVGKNSKDRT